MKIFDKSLFVFEKIYGDKVRNCEKLLIWLYFFFSGIKIYSLLNQWMDIPYPLKEKYSLPLVKRNWILKINNTTNGW